MTEQEKSQTKNEAAQPATKEGPIKGAGKGLAAHWQSLGGKDKKLILRLSTVLLLGLVLMYIAGQWQQQPAANSDDSTAALNTAQIADLTSGGTDEDLETKLLRILSAVEGAGQVEVALSYSESATSEYMLNSDTSQTTSNERDESGSVTSLSQTDSSSQSPAEINSEPVLIKQIMPPLSGAVIVAEGAADPLVKERLHKAARILLGLPAHKIEVLTYGP